jgi:hypothetical protein
LSFLEFPADSFDSWPPTPSLHAPRSQDRQMATHYETLDIDTDASPEESELSVSILGLRSLRHRFPPALPSPVLAFGLAPYLETDIIHPPSVL